MISLVFGRLTVSGYDRDIMDAVPDDPSMKQAMVFVREFEAIADDLVVQLETGAQRPIARERLHTELRDVREQIRRLQVAFELPINRDGA